MMNTLRQSLRALRHRPLFNTLFFTLLTLGGSALGTILVLVTATSLRPLPFRDATRLYAISTLESTGPNRSTEFALSAVHLRRLRDGVSAYDRVEAYTPSNPKLIGDGEPESLRGAAVTGGLLEMMGATAAMGRVFREDDDRPGADVVLLSHGYWQRRFGGDSAVLGSRLVIDDAPRTVIGVLPPTFTLFFRDADVLLPLGLPPNLANSPTYRVLATFGHLRPGATPEQAAGQISAVSSALATELPRVFKSSQPRVVPLRTSLLGAQQSTALLLLGAVAFLFLIACANGMNLAFADAIAHRTATLTRLALGATGRGIMVQRVTQAVLIGMSAGLAAVLLGRLTLAFLKSANPGAFAGMGTISFGVAMSTAVVLVSTMAAAAIAMPVAVSESRGDVSGLAGTVSKAVGNRTDRRRRTVLLTVQVAVTMMLLVGTAFLLQNVRALLSTSPGFEAAHMLVAPMTISSQTYATPPEKANHVARILDAVRAVPGVTAASTTQSRFVLAESMNAPFDVQEFPSATGESPLANIRHSTPGLVETLKMRLVAGRVIDENDRIDGAPVAMVNESFVKAYLGGSDAIGKHMRRANSAGPGPWMEIVGVVADVMDAGLGSRVGPMFYVSYLQQNTPTARVTLLVRTEGDPAALARSVRSAVWSVDRNQIIESVSTMDELIANSTSRPRFQALVTAFFATVAFVLALVGIYVVTLHDVLQLTREFGVRAALGAQSFDLILQAMGGALRPVAIGAAVGAVGSVPVVRWVSGLPGLAVSGVHAGDLPFLLGAVLLLVSGAAIVAFIAGRRVASIDPAIAMRAS